MGSRGSPGRGEGGTELKWNRPHPPVLLQGAQPRARGGWRRGGIPGGERGPLIPRSPERILSPGTKSGVPGCPQQLLEGRRVKGPVLSSAVPLTPSPFCSPMASVSLSSCSSQPSSAPRGQLLSPSVPDSPRHHQIPVRGALTVSPRSRHRWELPFPRPGGAPGG